MKTTVSSKGQIVLPAEFRRMDRGLLERWISDDARQQSIVEKVIDAKNFV